jgi:hypothetical protein
MPELSLGRHREKRRKVKRVVDKESSKSGERRYTEVGTPNSRIIVVYNQALTPRTTTSEPVFGPVVTAHREALLSHLCVFNKPFFEVGGKLRLAHEENDQLSISTVISGMMAISMIGKSKKEMGLLQYIVTFSPLLPIYCVFSLTLQEILFYLAVGLGNPPIMHPQKRRKAQ